ncbi:hypothetical protein N7451_012218 [Penicillium sp. IBT 35674x]|nr:hypothetical protein N7451_012218 [Penicillium sp. IBT 35674x]
MVSRHGPDTSSISTLSLELNTTAKVFVPLDSEPLSPRTKDISNFHALEKISQSHTLYVHFGKYQFTKDEIHPLRIFLRALRDDSFRALGLDHKRQGLAEGQLCTLRQAPPPYCEKPVSEQEDQVGLPAYRAGSNEQMAGNQRSAPLSVLPTDERQERLLFLSSPSLGSPTEPDTPSNDPLSTLSPSPPSIRPTVFRRVSAPDRAEINKLTDLEHQLRGVPDDTIRNLLTRAGYGHLLAKPDLVDSDLSDASEKASFAKDGMTECHTIKDYVDAMVKRHLQSHVNKIIDENCHLLYDLLGEHEREFRNEIDDFKSELRNATDDYLSEIEETHRESMGQLEAKRLQCLDHIQDQEVASKEEKIAKFKLNLTRRRQGHRSGLSLCKRQYLRQSYTKRRYRG